MLIVDSQIHLWANPGGPPHHRQEPYTVNLALADMDSAGVARAINCPAIWDAQANGYSVEAARQHPNRFATLGWFPLGVPRTKEEIAQFLDRPGMLGLRFVVMRPEDVAALQAGELDWLWQAAHDLARPVALIVPKPVLPELGKLADRFPQISFLLDHLNIGPMEKLPAAMDHLETLLALAAHPNIAIKASATPSMSNEPYPFGDVSPYLEQIFVAYGPERMFWGTDFTRMRIELSACVEMFTEHLPWLKGDDLESVMGRAICHWLDWPI
ncbi:MAG: amidohydrolase 2 [Rhizobium sp.]|nr:amidohydrolase 2 [Rhizobium sp.]